MPVRRATYRNSRTHTHTSGQFRVPLVAAGPGSCSAWTESTWTQGEITELNLHHSGSEAAVSCATIFLYSSKKKSHFFAPATEPPQNSPSSASFFRSHCFVLFCFVTHSCGFTISGFTPPFDHIACPSQENKLSAWTEASDAEMPLSHTPELLPLSQLCGFAVRMCEKNALSSFREPSSSSSRAGSKPSRETLMRCVSDSHSAVSSHRLANNRSFIKSPFCRCNPAYPPGGGAV